MSVRAKEYNTSSGKAGELDEYYEAEATDRTSTRQEEKAGQGEQQIAQTPTRLQHKAFSSFLAENIIWQSMYGATMGFFLYFAMYGIRKPFKAATFKDEDGNKIMWYVVCCVSCGEFCGLSLGTVLTTRRPLMWEIAPLFSQVWYGNDVENNSHSGPASWIHEFQVYWYQGHQ